ncbi:MAG TPA: ferritin-like domain-containing protein [Fimbriimonadaceae bacterium]|nr:ferritin-like domain-containing protein [Fimbriimonadaceae bacterium]
MTKPLHPSTPAGGTLDRRSFLGKSAAAGAALLPLGLLAGSESAKAARKDDPRGDAAILRFLAAAELIETDLWQQYAELATSNPDFGAALANIDSDMATYVRQNTEDELSHATFLNTFLADEHRQTINLDEFRTLPSSAATGAVQTKRLTSLMHLNVDTSYYTRYRSPGNPDFGDTFPQFVNIMNRPGIPLHDGYTKNQIQAIANTAAFHFGMIEQGGTSLYAAMAQKVSHLVSLHIVTGIGGSEIVHFSIWNEKAGNTIPVDSGDGLVFPDPTANTQFLFNQVMPMPCTFVDVNLPLCSVVRPTTAQQVTARGVVKFLNDTGLFVGQSKEFFRVMNDLAEDADEARR